MKKSAPIPTTVTTGRPWPLGAQAEAGGVNIAVFSAHAEAIEICVFDADGHRELARLRLPGRTGDVWHGRLEGGRPGLVYGLRAHGPWQPRDGQRFNPAKLLLDPYAREIVGQFDWQGPHFAAQRAALQEIDTQDNAAGALKARVVADAAFDWDGDASPAVPLADTVVYEMHVRGFSRLNKGVPKALRGTYAGLAHPASIAHLKRLGVTAVSLLPVHQHLDEERLVGMGLTNYWGYNTIGFFCPDPHLSATPHKPAATRAEFRAMVRALHAAGLELILDVVFNHTAESDIHGPSISFRGLDNASYYRLPPGARDDYINDTGCGNTVDLRHPRVLQLVMDSLRHWVTEYHVDGYRFDLATVLGRGDHGFDRGHPFFAAVAQDPVLARDGQPLTDAAWSDGHDRVLGVLIGMPGLAQGPLLMLLNAQAEDAGFVLPPGSWRPVLDSTQARGDAAGSAPDGAPFPLAAGSVVVLADAGVADAITRAIAPAALR